MSVDRRNGPHPVLTIKEENAIANYLNLWNDTYGDGVGTIWYSESGSELLEKRQKKKKYWRKVGQAILGTLDLWLGIQI